MWRDVSEYVGSLGLDAYLVGGAVRDELLGKRHKDEDFVVPQVGYEELHAALAPHGKVEPLEVAGQRVGLRLYPRDPAARTLAPAGIEFAPPRTERSTGPGRHDFEIVASGDITLEQDMARRDFTINAIAKRLSTGELLDPFDGEGDLRRGVLRTVSPNSFVEDPLRLVRALRFVSELDLDPDEQTLAQMREHAHRVRLVSAERIGGGLAADGLGELSRLLLGAQPAKALRLARDTGVLVQLLPEYGRAIGFDQESRYHELSVDEHHFEAVQHAADGRAPLPVRLALLVHDLGKPIVAWRGKDRRLHYYPQKGRPGHEEVGAQIAADALRRLRYPAKLQRHVTQIVRHHGFSPPQGEDGARARKFLARHGEALARDLISHKEFDLKAKGRPVDSELQTLAAFGRLVDRERRAPHRLADLALDGSDLIELGVPAGPEVGRVLDALLERVVEDPALNTRDRLLAEAKGLL
jgi:tRNA nucleotidyltransferase (CCA-adding enzyme)